MNIEIVEFFLNTVGADTINFMEYLETYMYKNSISDIDYENLNHTYNKWLDSLSGKL